MSPTLQEVDEALAHAKRIPIEDRGAAWWSFVDGLLEQRRELEKNDATPAPLPEEQQDTPFTPAIGAQG